jgi:hypothetical protein
VPVASIRREIDRQLAVDRDRGASLGILGLRVRAVAAAQRATLDQAEGAAPALRASLVDLAAVAEAVAADLPASPARG